MRPLALRAVVSIAAVLAVAAVLVALLFLDDPATVIAVCLLALAAKSLETRIGHGFHANLVSVVIVAAIVMAGPSTAVVAVAVAQLAPILDRRNVTAIKRIFNASQEILAAGAGGLTYVALGGSIGDIIIGDVPMVVALICVARLVSQVVNALLMCAVLWFERHTSPLEFLRYGVVPTALPLIGFSLLGVLLGALWMGGLGPIAGVLMLCPLVVGRWALSQYEAEKAAQAATMRAFIHVIETKDLYTRGHSERVSSGVGMLGKHLQLPEDRQAALEHAGLLHDVGKVGVPTQVIRKKGKLDDTEWAAIRLHPARGVELIGGIPFLEEVKSAVLHHHEKFDGTGYPAGLKGKRIPYFARMIGIVDAFDCLTSTRSYRPAKSVEETLGILIQDRNTHFDPQLVDSFVEVIRTQGWKAPDVAQPAPGVVVEAPIDHDDLSLGSGGGATGSAAGPAS